MTTVRCMGGPEAETRMVEAMFERTTGNLMIGHGISDEFQVTAGFTSRIITG